MKKTVLGYIKYISRRNLIFPGIILAAVIILALLLPIRSVLSPEEAASAGEIVSLSESGAEYVRIEFDALSYTGYDYYVNNRPVASYYYILNEDDADNVCMFFLVPTNSSENTADKILHYSANARIITGNTQFKIFLDEFSDDIGWSHDGLLDACSGLLVSSYDYHSALYIILLVLLALIFIWALAYILANVIILIDPTRHEACRRLIKYGLDGEDFTAIDEELAHDTIINAGNLFATTHYLVAFGQHSIFVVPLFNIIWAYKYSSWNHFSRIRKLKYTLVVTTSPKDTIRVPGNRKKDVDKILNFLGEDFSHITIGYSEEIRAQIDKLIK